MEKVLYLKTTIEQILNDNKAIDVSSIDLKDKSSVAAKKMPLNRWKFIKFNKVNISSSQIRKI